MKNSSHVVLCTAVILFFGVGVNAAEAQQPQPPAARAPIPGQLAQDFTAGRVPRLAEIEEAEKDVAANPTDLHMTRRLGKAYFFQFFGGGNQAAIPKAMATFDRALELKKDDPETLAYYGALYVFVAKRVDKADPAKQKAGYDKGFEMLQRAEKLALTLGRAYAATGNTDKARANFDEALLINQESTEAGLLKSELAKLSKP